MTISKVNGHGSARIFAAGVGCTKTVQGKTMKKKKKKLEKGKEARRRARATGLAPAGTRTIEDKRKKPEKHKGRWLEEDKNEG
jgi:hypothetical protein